MKNRCREQNCKHKYGFVGWSVGGVIMSLGAVIAYIVGEGLVDAAATNGVSFEGKS